MALKLQWFFSCTDEVRWASEVLDVVDMGCDEFGKWTYLVCKVCIHALLHAMLQYFFARCKDMD